MPIYNGLSTKNQAEIITGNKQMMKVYCGEKLVWQKFKLKGGLFYNRPAVEDVGELAPTDWRVAGLADYMDIITFYGGESLAGAELKTLEGWAPSSTPGRIDSVFDAKGAGQRDQLGAFSDQLLKAIFWIK